MIWDPLVLSGRLWNHLGPSNGNGKAIKLLDHKIVIVKTTKDKQFQHVMNLINKMAMQSLVVQPMEY